MRERERGVDRFDLARFYKKKGVGLCCCVGPNGLGLGGLDLYLR